MASIIVRWSDGGDVIYAGTCILVRSAILKDVSCYTGLAHWRRAYRMYGGGGVYG